MCCSRQPGPGLVLQWTWKPHSARFDIYLSVCQRYLSKMFSSSSSSSSSSGIPAFDPLLQSQSASISSTVQFLCHVLSNPPATVTWSFNGAQLSNSDKYTITSTMLTVSNIQLSDDGYYQCRASNSFGTNHTNARLTVTGWLDVNSL